jgi:hypothetical protein
MNEKNIHVVYACNLVTRWTNTQKHTFILHYQSEQHYSVFQIFSFVHGYHGTWLQGKHKVTPQIHEIMLNTDFPEPIAETTIQQMWYNANFVYRLRWSNPCTGLDRSLGLHEVGAPRFQDNRHMKTVRLSVQCTGCLYTPRKYPWYSLLLEAGVTPGSQCGQKDCQWHTLLTCGPCYYKQFVCLDVQLWHSCQYLNYFSMDIFFSR